MRYQLTVTACLLLLASLGVRGQECTWSPAMRSAQPRETWRELSAQAETMARRRTVRFPMPVQGPANFIDEITFARMKEANIRWAPRSTDAEFLRRIHLNLTGQIPTAARAREFLASTDPRKRERLIDELLQSDGYVDRWSLWLGDLVQNVEFANMVYVGPQGRSIFYLWMRDALANNKPYDDMVREMIVTSASSADVRASMWVVRRRIIGPQQDTFDNLAAASAEHFLSLPMNCISCHDGRGHLEQVNSALATRTRLDFWKNAAFFARTRIIGGGAFGAAVLDNPTGNYRLGTTSGNKTPRVYPNLDEVEPEFLTGGKPEGNETWREAYARMLLAHPRFAPTAVNRIWKEMLGLGIVEPVGNMELERDILQRKLLDELAAFFRDSGYDLRALLRAIAMSETYQLSSAYPAGTWAETSTPYFARHLPRRMLAESVLDAIFRATHVGGTMFVRDLPPVTSAMKLPDTLQGGPLRPFLDDFGRGNRDDEDRSGEMSIPQALRLINDSAVTSRAGSADGLPRKLVRDGKTPREIVEELYLTTLTRFPTDEERRVLEAELAKGPLAEQAVDLQLALLQSVEFLFY